MPTDPPPITTFTVVDPPLLTFPTRGKVPEWHLTQPQLDQWTDLYPALGVLAECRKALGWVLADTSHRKTAGGMPTFLVRWLNRSTDRGGGATVITGSLKTAGNQEAIRRFIEKGEAK